MDDSTGPSRATPARADAPPARGREWKGQEVSGMKHDAHTRRVERAERRLAWRLEHRPGDLGAVEEARAEVARLRDWVWMREEARRGR